MRTRLHASVISGALLVSACGSSESARSDRADPTGEDAGADGGVEAGTGTPVGDGAPEGGDAGAPDVTCDGGGPACVSSCCAADEVCGGDVRCVPQQARCETQDDCQHDTYCVAGECVPFGPGRDRDDTCEKNTSLASIKPVVQCAWTEPPTGDAHPDYNNAMVTTIVADLDADGDPTTLHPSIIFPTFPRGGNYYLSPGVLRVISGTDCTQEFSVDAPEDAVSSISPVAVADLTGDGRPEVVAATSVGGVIAFRLSDDRKSLTRLWRSGTCSGGTVTPDSTGGSSPWSGPSIYDLDDDGIPEVLYGAVVYSGKDGCVLSSSLGFGNYSLGVVPVVADLDGNGKAELVLGEGLWEWDATLPDWVAKPHVASATGAGQVAVAELGDFPVTSQDGKDHPEIVVVSSGTVRVQTIDGTVVFGPYGIPGGGTGGAPTVADFDGDGRREIGVAGGSNYVVFDLDCVPGGEASRCATTAGSPGVLWAQASQDRSSNVTGSSVFDFDADGHAEVAYADECFFRIYDGATGAVVASRANTSGTTYENPVMVDADGDFRTEIVISANDYYVNSLGCPASDPLFPATTFAATHGVYVLRDESDGWAASRPIWNQHAYSVTNVDDHGRVPKTSEWSANWADSTLNNFRQNSQGGLVALGIGDLTVSDAGTVCREGTASLGARVCNRGTLPIAAGVAVAFTDASTELCRAATEQTLTPGECVVVRCDANASFQDATLRIEADPGQTEPECHEGNNLGRVRVGTCQ